MYASGEYLPKILIDLAFLAVHYKYGRFLPLSDYQLCVVTSYSTTWNALQSRATSPFLLTFVSQPGFSSVFEKLWSGEGISQKFQKRS